MNSIITESKYKWIYVNWVSNSVISNTILYNNWTYWLYNNWSWTPTISNNLYYSNSTDSNVLIESNSITWQDPLFIDEINYELETLSPAIDAWTGISPDSWNTIDIWVREIGFWAVSFLDLSYGVNITWVEWRNLTFEWSFYLQPNWSNILLSNSTWNLSIDWSLSTTFTVSKLWSYTLKIVIKEDWEIIWTWTNSFEIN